MVYEVLLCDNIIFEGRVESVKRAKLLYDDVERHYHVITNLTSAMAKKYLCKACNKSCRSDVTHVCDQTCSVCATSPPCAFGGIRIPCEECNRHFRNRACFDNHKRRSTAKKRSVCECQRYCGTCGVLVTGEITNVINDTVRTAARKRSRPPVLHETVEGRAALRRRQGVVRILRF